MSAGADVKYALTGALRCRLTPADFDRAVSGDRRGFAGVRRYIRVHTARAHNDAPLQGKRTFAAPVGAIDNGRKSKQTSLQDFQSHESPESDDRRTDVGAAIFLPLPLGEVARHIAP